MNFKQVSSSLIEALGIPWCYRPDSPDMVLSGRAFIINLDERGGKGTHWVAARAAYGTLYYADPFGSILGGYPPREIERAAPRVIWNRIAFQHPSTQLCGYYSILFARALDRIDRELTQKEFEQLLYEVII